MLYVRYEIFFDLIAYKLANGPNDFSNVAIALLCIL